MSPWIASMLRFRALVVPLAIGVLVVGIAQLRKAPVDVLPEYTRPYVQVQTDSLGLSAAEVEQLITVPLEQDLLNGVKGVETIRSDSIPGVSSITLLFERGTDVLRARQLVSERLSQPHAFPSVGSAPQMIQPVSSANRVMMIALSSKRLSPIELSVLARWTVRPRLMGVPGVANVAIWGHRDRQLQVLVDPRRLRRRHVSLLQVVKTTGNAQLVSPLTFLNASTPGTGGFLDGPNQRLGVRHVLPFGAPRDLAQVPVENTSLRLGDVARVVEDHQPLVGDAVVRGGEDGDGLLLVVEKLPGTNTLALTRRLEDALDEMRPGLQGVRIDSSLFRPASFIESAMANLGLALLIAGALVIAALAAYFRDWRPVVIGAVAVPLSIVAAVLVLDLAGATINALVVAGLVAATGAVVGAGVGDVEAMARRVREERGAGGDRPAARIVLESSLRSRGAATTATLILLLLIAPVFFLGGLTGAFLHPLALAYALAVLASTAVALTVTPALGAVLFARPGPERGAPAFARRASAASVAALARLTRTPRPALFALCGLLLTGAALVPALHPALRPSFKDRQVVVRWQAAPSASLPEMHRITSRATAEMRAIPGVRDAGAHVGRAIGSDQVVGTGSGEMWVTIDGAADRDATLAAIRRVASGYPGLRGTVLTYETDRTQGVLTRPDRDLVVRVYGQDLGILEQQATRVRRLVSGVDGVDRPRVQAPPVQPTLQIQVDLAAARRYGVKPGDVRRAAATLVQGLDVGAFFEEQKVFQVIVRGVPATRGSVQAVRDLLIDTPGGRPVRLGDLARVRIAPNPVDIRHDAVSRYVDVRAAVSGRDLGAVQADVKRRLRGSSLPLEYHAEVVRTPGDEASPLRPFLTVAAVAAAGVFLLLQAAFASWTLAALVFLTLPVALVGGLAVVAAGGGDLSLGAAFGLMAVLGIAACHGLAFVTRLQAHERENGGARRAEAVARTTAERLGPTLITTAVTALALAPLAALGDIAGNEITHSMAAVALGGLVTTTALAGLILPALCLHAVPARRGARAKPERAEADGPDLDLLPGT
jgi:Cu/Ag efflux pump CusA